MSTRSVQVFITPDELGTFIVESCDRLALRMRDESFEEMWVSREDLASRFVSSRQPLVLFLSPQSPDSTAVDQSGIPPDAVPAANGWVQVDGLTINDKVLSLASFASKTDWWDGNAIRQASHRHRLLGQ